MSKWISINYRPPFDVNVLLTDGTDVHIGHLHCVRACGNVFSGADFLTDIFGKNVTSWMPLPEPTEEK